MGRRPARSGRSASSSRRPIGSQRELADVSRERGMDAAQATVSRDIAELGLVKSRAGGHAYVG
jgi:arginine repressor